MKGPKSAKKSILTRKIHHQGEILPHPENRKRLRSPVVAGFLSL
jgi:hypothetical protein